MAQRCDLLAPRRAARHSRQSGSAVPPGVRARTRVQPALPAWRRAALHLGGYSCTLPVAFQPGIGHQQLLHANLLIVECHRHLKIASGADESLNGPAAETPVPNPFALHVTRRILRGLVVCWVARQGGSGAVAAGSDASSSPIPPPGCPAAPLARRPIRRPQRCRPPFFHDAGRYCLQEAGRYSGAELAASPPGPGPGQVELVLGPGEAYVA